MILSQDNPCVPLQNLRGEDLKSLFQRMLSLWMLGRSWEPQLLFREPPYPADLERQVVLEGPERLFLTFSASSDFGLQLAAILLRRPAEPEEGEDAFRELINLFCGHLQTRIWGTETCSRPFLATPPGARPWPVGMPGADTLAQAGPHWIRIRLWREEGSTLAGESRHG